MTDSSLGSRMPIAHANRKRRISPQAGRALEILGHSIEYLVDEIADSLMIEEMNAMDM